MISVAQLTGQAGAALAQLNSALVQFGGLPFCTLACVQLLGDPDDGPVEITSAGHPLPYLVGGDGASSAGRTGPSARLRPERGVVRLPVSVAPGEAIVLYSDGVTDTVGPGRERFGERAAGARAWRDSPTTAPRELVERLDRELLEFQDTDQHDDIAVLVLRREA